MIKLSFKKKLNQTGIPEFSPTHAGTLVPEEESPNSCEDDTSSESSDSGDSSNDSLTRVISSDVCTGERNPTSKLGMRGSMGGDFFQGGVALILSLCPGKLKLIFA